MKWDVIGKDIEVTPAIRSHIESKLSILERHANNLVSIHLSVSVPDKHRQQAEATVHLAPKKTLHATAETPDLYQSIDQLLHKLDRQIIEYNKQLKEHH